MAKAITADGKTKAAKTPKAAKPTKSDKPNFFARLMQYFRDVRGEMKRVVWPTRPEIINSSVVVIVTLIFFSALIFAIDTVVVYVLRLVNGIG